MKDRRREATPVYSGCPFRSTIAAPPAPRLAAQPCLRAPVEASASACRPRPLYRASGAKRVPEIAPSSASASRSTSRSQWHSHLPRRHGRCPGSTPGGMLCLGAPLADQEDRRIEGPPCGPCKGRAAARKARGKPMSAASRMSAVRAAVGLRATPTSYSDCSRDRRTATCGGGAGWVNRSFGRTSCPQNWIPRR
jgi:hypothetical protein